MPAKSASVLTPTPRRVTTYHCRPTPSRRFRAASQPSVRLSLISLRRRAGASTAKSDHPRPGRKGHAGILARRTFGRIATPDAPNETARAARTPRIMCKPERAPDRQHTTRWRGRRPLVTMKVSAETKKPASLFGPGGELHLDDHTSTSSLLSRIRAIRGAPEPPPRFVRPPAREPRVAALRPGSRCAGDSCGRIDKGYKPARPSGGPRQSSQRPSPAALGTWGLDGLAWGSPAHGFTEHSGADSGSSRPVEIPVGRTSDAAAGG